MKRGRPPLLVCVPSSALQESRSLRPGEMRRVTVVSLKCAEGLARALQREAHLAETTDDDALAGQPFSVKSL